MCFCDVFIIVIICFELNYMFWVNDEEEEYVTTVLKRYICFYALYLKNLDMEPYLINLSMLNITQIFNNTKFSQDCLFVAFNIQMLLLVHYVLT